MYSWKIIHGKHKRIALQSLINCTSDRCMLVKSLKVSLIRKLEDLTCVVDGRSFPSLKNPVWYRRQSQVGKNVRILTDHSFVSQ